MAIEPDEKLIKHHFAMHVYKLPFSNRLTDAKIIIVTIHCIVLYWIDSVTIETVRETVSNCRLVFHRSFGCKQNHIDLCSTSTTCGWLLKSGTHNYCYRISIELLLYWLSRYHYMCIKLFSKSKHSLGRFIPRFRLHIHRGKINVIGNPFHCNTPSIQHAMIFILALIRRSLGNDMTLWHWIGCL